MRNAIARCCSAATCAAMAVMAAGASAEALPTAAATASESFSWPASLAPFGDGYPKAGDVCRRLGESSMTSAWLDHTATLVGCPGADDSASAQAIVRQRHGRVVGNAEGVTLISVPNEGHVAAMPEQRDGIRATGTLRCARRAGQRMRVCRFDIARHDDRSAVLVVYLPGGGTRAIFFDPDGNVAGVAGKATDRPTRQRVSQRKSAGVDSISIGRERYRVPDAVLNGG